MKTARTSGSSRYEPNACLTGWVTCVDDYFQQLHHRAGATSSSTWPSSVEESFEQLASARDTVVAAFTQTGAAINFSQP